MTDSYDVNIKKVSILLNINYDTQIFCYLSYITSIQFRVLSSVHGILFLPLFSNLVECTRIDNCNILGLHWEDLVLPSLLLFFHILTLLIKWKMNVLCQRYNNNIIWHCSSNISKESLQRRCMKYLKIRN